MILRCRCCLRYERAFWAKYMKKILFIISLVPCLAFAEQWLEAKNEDGGKIVLMEARCSEKYPNLKMMMVTSRKGQTFFGCWAYFSGAVHVTYDDGTSYTYAPEIFVLKKDDR